MNRFDKWFLGWVVWWSRPSDFAESIRNERRFNESLNESIRLMKEFDDKKKEFAEKAKADLRLEVTLSVPGGDLESTHGNADDILCDLLCNLGHGDVVDIYKEVGKWYA